MSQRQDGKAAIATVLSAAVVVVVGFAVGIAATLLAAFGLVFAGVPVFENMVVAIVVSVVGQGLGFGVAALGYLRYRNLGIEFLRLRVPTLRDVGWMALGLVIMFVALIGIGVLIETLGLPEPADHQIAELGAETPELLLVLVPLSFLVIGPGEELLFRGVIQTRLVEAFGMGAGIGVTSVIFSLAHLVAYSGAGLVVALGVLFVMSVILGVLYEVTENLVVPAVIHGAYNAILFLGLFVSIT